MTNTETQPECKKRIQEMWDAMSQEERDEWTDYSNRQAAFKEQYPELVAEKAKIDEEHKAVKELLAASLDKREAIGKKYEHALVEFNKTWKAKNSKNQEESGELKFEES